ncbi:hypothetical protein BJ508DRAFT_311845 [Ascobolus immersus RN42]|uniref:Uncharacterized protein n=1 Tax=Ascobolus immersus RN42 TaxID=1160509 RepID=A0A3N4HRE1_ASCIM|nr:hypothetical protein BJ508DRAFT_311845 [Ascobolus immersus RN42]
MPPQPRFSHPSDAHLSLTLLLPATLHPNTFPNLKDYTPVDTEDFEFTVEILTSLFALPSESITAVLLPHMHIPLPHHSDPSTFLIQTTSGTFELTYPSTYDLSPGPWLLRTVHPWHGARGPWIAPTEERERAAEEENLRRNIEAGWGRPLGEITEEQRASVAGCRELGWMELVGRRNGHAGVLWIKMGKPGVGTEEERREFVRRWREHVRGCGFVKRECNYGGEVETTGDR